MRWTFYGSIALVLGFAASASLTAESSPAASTRQGAVEAAVGYDLLRANTVAGRTFWMQGGFFQVDGTFWRGLGAVADVRGNHVAQMPGLPVGLDLLTATFGPRYSWTPRRGHVTIYGQFLIGEGFGWNSIFPNANGAPESASGLALQLGGGLTCPLTRHLGLRVVEADWVRTQLGNATTGVQNSLHVGMGMVFRR